MKTEKEIYHEIIEAYNELNYMAEKDGIALIKDFVSEVSREVAIKQRAADGKAVIKWCKKQGLEIDSDGHPRIIYIDSLLITDIPLSK